MKLNYGMSLLLALVLAALVTVGCGKTVGQTIDDTAITTRVPDFSTSSPSRNEIIEPPRGPPAPSSEPRRDA